MPRRSCRGINKLPRQLHITISGGCSQFIGSLRVNTSATFGTGGIEILLAGFARAQRGVKRIQDGRLSGIQRFGSLAFFFQVDQDFVRVRSW